MSLLASFRPPFDVSSSHPRASSCAILSLSLFSPTSSTAFQLPPQPPQFPCSPKLQSGEKALTRPPAPAPQSHWLPPALQHLAPPATRLASGPINPRLAVLTSSCSRGDGVGMRERERERESEDARLQKEGAAATAGSPLPSRPGWGLPGSAPWTRLGGRLLSISALLSALSPPLFGEPLHPLPKVEQAGLQALGASNRGPALPTTRHDPLAVSPLAGLPDPLQLL